MRDELPAVLAGLVSWIVFLAFFSFAGQVPLPGRSAPTASVNDTYYGHSYYNGTLLPVSIPHDRCQSVSSTPIASTSSAPFLPLKERVWISVRPTMPNIESRVIEGKCIIVDNATLVKYPEVLTGLLNATRCVESQDICYGLRLPRANYYEYSISTSQDQALSIAQEFGITYKGIYKSFDGRTQEVFNPSTIVYDNKLYKVYLETADSDGVGMQAEAKLIPREDRGGVTINVLPGQSKNITLSFRTFATYGGPTTIDLSAWTSASDSGLVFEFHPSQLVIPEQSHANTTLVVKALPIARDGVYKVKFNDTVNNGVRNNDGGALFCGVNTQFSNYDVCLRVIVGNSSWEISNTGTESLSGYGGSGGSPLSAKMETDKDIYRQSDNVTISIYFTNNSNRTFVFPVRSGALAINIFNQTTDILSEQVRDIVYGIQANAFANSNETITMKPHSRILFLRPFTWDQKTFSTAYPGIRVVHSVPPGKYYLQMSFVSFSDATAYASTKKTITITPSH